MTFGRKWKPQCQKQVAYVIGHVKATGIFEFLCCWTLSRPLKPWDMWDLNMSSEINSACRWQSKLSRLRSGIWLWHLQKRQSVRVINNRQDTILKCKMDCVFLSNQIKSFYLLTKVKKKYLWSYIRVKCAMLYQEAYKYIISLYLATCLY